MSACYSIHGLAQLVVEGDSAQAQLAAHFLDGFRTHASDGGMRWYPDGRPPDDAVAVAADGAAHVVAGPDGWTFFGQQNVYAMLQCQLVRSGASLVHGCALEVDGEGVLVWGRGGVGKSTVALSVYDDERVHLLSDDKVVALEDGTVASFPAPLSIYPYHDPLFPPDVRRSLSRRRRRGLAARVVKSIPAGVRAGGYVRRRLLALGGTVSSIAAEVNADYLAIAQRDLFPPDRLCATAELTHAIELVRGGTRWEIHPLEADECRRGMIATTYLELEMAQALAGYALAGLVDLADHYRRADEAIDAFLAGTRLTRLSVPDGARPADLQRTVLELARGRQTVPA